MARISWKSGASGTWTTGSNWSTGSVPGRGAFETLRQLQPLSSSVDSWKTAVSGNWSNAADWSTGLLPQSTSAVTLGRAGAYTVTQDVAATIASLTLSNSAVTLDIDQGLTVSRTADIDNATVAVQGGTLAAKSIVISDGALQLGSSGVVQGGTIDNVGGDVSSIGGTLSATKFEGTLDLTPAGSSLTLANNTSFAGIGGAGAGTIDMTSDTYPTSNLNVLGTGTLNNATINIGSNWVNPGFYDYLVNQDTTGKGAVLTLGSGLAIDQTGAQAQISSSNMQGDRIVNDGTINATYNGGVFDINANNANKVTNNGVINIGNGDFVGITNLTNFGLVNLTGGILDLYGVVTASLLNSLNLAGGVAQITDTVTGGTIVAPNGGIGSNGGTLSDVAVQGTLDLTPSGSVLTITKGTRFAGTGGTGAGTIDMTSDTYPTSTLNVLGTGTLNNATINIGSNWVNPGFYDYLVNQDTTGKGAVLTLGSGLAIDQTGAQAQISSSNMQGDRIVNDGTINATYNGGVFYINANNANKFTNNGVINIGNGDFVGITNLTNFGLVNLTGGILDLYGVVTASLLNSLNLAGGVAQITDTVTGGTIVAPNGGIGSNGGTLSDVAVQGTLDLTPSGSVLTITKGTSFTGTGGTGAGTIDMTSDTYPTSTLNVLGTGTLNNATINIGSNWVNPGFYDYLVNQDTTGKGAVLTLGSGLVIDQTGAQAQISSSNLRGDQIINDGTITAAYDGGVFDINSNNTNSFTNNGVIAIGNGDLVGITNLVNSGMVNLTGGRLDLYGAVTANLIDSINLAGGVVQITDTVTGGTISAPNGGVGGNGGTLSGVTFQGTLDLTSSGSSLTLANNTTFAGAGGIGAATIDMTADAYPTSTLTVQGTATLDNATINIGDNWPNPGYYDYIVNQDVTGKGAVLTLGTRLVINQTGAQAEMSSSTFFGDGVVNDGAINADYDGGIFIIGAAALTNIGSITASNGDTLDITSSHLSGGGTLQVESGATLSLQGQVSAGVTASFNGTGAVLGLAPMSFAGAIGGFASGDTIDLANTAASAAHFSGSSIVVTLTAGGTLTLTTTSALAGALTVTAGTDNDSLIRFAGAPAPTDFMRDTGSLGPTTHPAEPDHAGLATPHTAWMDLLPPMFNQAHNAF